MHFARSLSAQHLGPVLVALLSSAAPAAAHSVQQSAPAVGDASLEAAEPAPQPKPENVILLIADGFGPTSLTLAAGFAEEPLELEGLLLGAQVTHASDSVVTDSGASATAMASGVKTYNGAVGVDAQGRPVRTLLEAAEERSMATGLVATSRITHATPAAFCAHVVRRDMEAEIADQQLQQGIEVLLGGGQKHFDEARLATAEQTGYRIVTDRAGFDSIEAVPVLGLFTEDHMAFELDRDPAQEPSLAEMTAKAIELLDPLPGGFFLMIEGSRIDHAGHINDSAAHLHDILAYDAAVRVAADFARANGATLVVSTADHETGGMSLGRSVENISYYDWRADVLGEVKASGPVIAEALLATEDLDATVSELTGITKLSQTDRTALEEVIATGDPSDTRDTILRVISKRARIGWTTNGHTAVDVQVFGMGPGSELFRGRRDNTELALTLAALMDLELGLIEAD